MGREHALRVPQRRRELRRLQDGRADLLHDGDFVRQEVAIDDLELRRGGQGPNCVPLTAP